MQTCFVNSLTALRTWRSEDKGSFYGAFFGFTIGLERLLKVLLLMNSWNLHRQFLTDSELRKSGHDLENLYGSAANLFQQYGVELKNNLEQDKIDRKLLMFLSSFAIRSRYYNLYTLTDEEVSANPLGEWEDLLREIYENDVPTEKQLPDLDENDILVDQVNCDTCEKLTRTGSTYQTRTEHNYDQRKMAIALPEMCWRLVKLLAPLQTLLIAIHEKIRVEDHGRDGELSVPHMEEFLEFVCEDKNVIFESEDWP